MKPLLLLCFIISLHSCSKNTTTGTTGTPADTTHPSPVPPVPPPAPACPGTTLAQAENINIFPADNPWNTAIDATPLDSRSNAIITLIANNNPSLKADFGSGLWDNAPIGIPYVVVCGNQPQLPIVYRANGYDGNYGDESDPGPFPIPANAPIEGNGNGDSHVIAVDVENKKLYELYNASRGSNSWEASSGALFNLNSNALRPTGWTSADAAGLPIFPGLVRYEEVLKGVIDHPIRFTLRSSKVSRAYIDPARHKVNGGNTSSSAPVPFGMRIRLKASFNISSFSPVNRVILQAMKTYGLILADIGSDLYISGAPDERWNNDDLRNLGQLKATDFEVVQMGALH